MDGDNIERFIKSLEKIARNTERIAKSLEILARNLERRRFN